MLLQIPKVEHVIMSSSVQPEFLVRHEDGRDYPADAATLQRWAIEGYVRPNHFVYWTAAGRWLPANELPLLQPIFQPGLPPPVRPSRPAARPLRTIGIVVGLVFIVFMVLIAVEDGTKTRSKEGASPDALPKETEDALRERAPATATALDRELIEIEMLERSRDLEGAKTKLEAVRRRITPYLRLQPQPPSLSKTIAKYDSVRERVTRRAGFVKRYTAAVAQREQAAHLIEQKKWLDADNALRESAATLDELSDASEADQSMLPPSFQPARERASVAQLLKRIEKQVRRERKAEAANAAFAAVCGPKPYCSQWDGECGNIESALKKVAHDPGSIDVENCTVPTLHRDQCWVTTCDVRGKNAFGALVLQRKRFSISNLGVSEID